MEPYCEVLTTGFCSVKMIPDPLIRERLNRAQRLNSARRMLLYGELVSYVWVSMLTAFSP